MKRTFTIILIMALSIIQTQARPCLRNCDLLFVAQSGADIDGQDSMDGAIAAATADVGASAVTHVAMLERRFLSLWVIDATPQHGVSRRRYKSFIEEQTPGSTVIVKRVVGLRKADRRRIIKKAKTFLWQSYDFTFLPDNDMMYCSELIRESFRDRKGAFLFDAAPMNFLSPDGSLPEFWHELFESLETEVPQGVPGTNPQDMSESPLLKTVMTFNI